MMYPRLPSYQELQEDFPLSSQQRLFIQKTREQIARILSGADDRLLCILGPCSFHDLTAMKEVAMQLKAAQSQLEDRFFLVMRSYFEKPRSLFGWKGFLYDPLLDGSYRMDLGLQWTRRFLMEMADLELPVATEFLDPLAAPYYEDCISWGCIGARTSASAPHRQMAALLQMPTGMKNAVSGDLSVAIQGVYAASQPQTVFSLNAQGEPSLLYTKGNPDVHLVLRGGEGGPNHTSHHIQDAQEKLSRLGLPTALVVDCAHDNAGKVAERQIPVFRQVLAQIQQGNPYIRGVMFEAHLKEGRQVHVEDVQSLAYGVSLTDACVGLDALLFELQQATLCSSDRHACQVLS